MNDHPCIATRLYRALKIYFFSDVKSLGDNVQNLDNKQEQMKDELTAQRERVDALRALMERIDGESRRRPARRTR